MGRELAPNMCYGVNARGFGIPCPRDGLDGCALVDALNMEGYAGRATHFLSWVWGYHVSTFVSAIGAWVDMSEEIEESSTYLWVCFFCNNQFRMAAANADDLEVIFEQRLQKIGKMVAMLD